MSTRIEIPYDRQFTDSEIEAEIVRGTATVNVLKQLGVAYQTLPGYALAAYEAEVDALEADASAINGHLNAIRVLLIAQDAKGGPLHSKNIGALKALSGLLTTDAQHALLAQITGPTPQGGGGAPPPPPTP
ncbi:MAG: hypothetical protein WCI21_06195 [Alphaproteobacteria bacterium]